jgi:monofunctional biosynthetic peptidoglycan transglycosylase
MPRTKRKAQTRKRGSRSRARRLLRVLGLVAVSACVVTLGPIAVLRFLPPPTTAFMLGSYWSDPATGRACAQIAYDWAPWSRVARDVPRAILVAEDQRFFEHHGFDTKAIGDALEDYSAGSPMRGASTVSQQVAKNLFLWPGRSLLRKGLEAWLTIWIELLWPKQRILEVHMNVAQFGPCVFGVEAAGRRYFGVSAAALSALQAARLAAVLPAPGRMRLEDPGSFTQERAGQILAELRRRPAPAYLRGL